MNKLYIFLIVGFGALMLLSCEPKSKTFYEQLCELPGVVSVDSIEIDTHFVQQYELYFEQPLDHKNPEDGSFKQRVILSHKSTDLPMVAVLEGYKIWSATQCELSQILESNQINIEHRFFEDSRPDSIPWDKLTIAQAATDQHKIIEALKTLYPNKWVTTGISKGGQTTMYHRSFYPDDVDASVPYVAPLNLSREDPRIYAFLENVGTSEERGKIEDFQALCFENFDTLKLLLEAKSEEEGWTFKIGYERALIYSILEYPFAFWQWGACTIDDIVEKGASTNEIFDHLDRVAGFTFFEDQAVEDLRPFFWAALTEIGIYGYPTTKFSEYLGDTVYTFDFTAPEGYLPSFKPNAMRHVQNYLDNEAVNMLFIVGGLDPWGATAYEPSGKNNLVTMRVEAGSHVTRIKSFSYKEQLRIYKLLEEWLELELPDPISEEKQE